MNKVAIILPILVITVVIVNFSINLKKVEYEVLECNVVGDYRNYYYYDKDSKMMTAFVTVNCASDGLLVEKDDVIRIIEVEKDGLLARCLCKKEVRIYNVEDLKVVFINYGGNVIEVEKDGFCGLSTFSYCEKDDDCKIGGCSGQVCMGINENLFTTCEYRSCYDYRKYQMECKCFNNKCQWIKKFNIK